MITENLSWHFCRVPVRWSCKGGSSCADGLGKWLLLKVWSCKRNGSCKMVLKRVCVEIGCKCTYLLRHVGLRYQGATTRGATPASSLLISLANPYLWINGGYMLQAALSLLSCIDQVKCRAGL